MNATTSTRRERHERGLAMLDVLIGIAIFAIIAVVATSWMHHERVKAYEASAMEDARNVANSLIGEDDESGATAPTAAGLPSSMGDLALAAAHTGTQPARSLRHLVAEITDPVAATHHKLSSGNRLVDWLTLGDYEFSFCVEHVSGDKVDAYAAYRSDVGGIYAHGRSDGCPDIGVGDTPITPDGDDAESPADGDTSTPAPPPSDTDSTVSPDEAPTAPSAPTDPASPATPAAETSESPADDAATGPEADPSTDPTDPAEPGSAPVLWTSPTSDAEIEALCTTNWGDAALYGDGEVINGTEGPDIIFTGNGGQTVYGNGGDDLICGANGKDVLYGGDGDDVIFGGNGKDTLYGGPGTDYLHGNNGKDSLVDGDGYEDHIFGGSGKDTYINPRTDDPEDVYTEED